MTYLPRWSNNGQTIAFVSDRHTDTRSARTVGIRCRGMAKKCQICSGFSPVLREEGTGYAFGVARVMARARKQSPWKLNSFASNTLIRADVNAHVYTHNEKSSPEDFKAIGSRLDPRSNLRAQCGKRCHMAQSFPDSARTVTMGLYAAWTCGEITQGRSHKSAYPKACGCDTKFGDLSEQGGIPSWDMEEVYAGDELCNSKETYCRYASGLLRLYFASPKPTFFLCFSTSLDNLLWQRLFRLVCWSV